MYLKQCMATLGHDLFTYMWMGPNQKRPPDIEEFENEIRKRIRDEDKFKTHTLVYYEVMYDCPLVHFVDPDVRDYDGEPNDHEVISKFGSSARIINFGDVQYHLYKAMNYIQRVMTIYLKNVFLKQVERLRNKYNQEEILVSEYIQMWFNENWSILGKVVPEMKKNEQLIQKVLNIMFNGYTYQQVKEMAYSRNYGDMAFYKITVSEIQLFEKLFGLKYNNVTEAIEFELINIRNEIDFELMLNKYKQIDISKVYRAYEDMIQENERQLANLYERKMLLELYFRRSPPVMQISILPECVMFRFETTHYSYVYKYDDYEYIDEIKRKMRIVETLALEKKCTEGVLGYLLLKSFYFDDEYQLDSKFIDFFDIWNMSEFQCEMPDVFIYYKNLIEGDEF